MKMNREEASLLFGARFGLSTRCRLAVLAALAISACQTEPGTWCGDGYCGVGYECTADQGTWKCIRPDHCGNSVPEEGEVCDDGNESSGDGCSGDCLSDETCGNGVTDVGEACDDGNPVSNDGCSQNCASDETCGNGILDPSEACDDGNQVFGDGCSGDCLSDETCGNGILDPVLGEVCDDGNNWDQDGCPSACKYGCEEDANRNYLVCTVKVTWLEARAACQLHGSHLVTIHDSGENFMVASLLDGRVWIGLSDTASEGSFRWVDGSGISYAPWVAGEPNDEGGMEDCVEVGYMAPDQWNDLPCDQQRPFICEISASGSECGNGQVEPGEECDDGNEVAGDGCDDGCRIEGECGNGQVEPGEECDDGNEVAGDGCDDGCRIESVLETEPNEDGTPEIGSSLEGNDFSTVNANDPYQADAIVSARLEPAGDEDVFAVSNRGSGSVQVRFDTHDAAAGRGVPCQAMDTMLLVRDTQGSILAANDDRIPGADFCSTVEYVIGPGETVYAHVLAFGDGSAIPEPGYWLTIDFE
jgi:cysteine-rich repeat protein